MVDREMIRDSIWDQLESEQFVCLPAAADQKGIEAKPMTPYCRCKEGIVRSSPIAIRISSPIKLRKNASA